MANKIIFLEILPSVILVLLSAPIKPPKLIIFMHTVDDYSSPPLHAYVLDLIIADCQQILNTSERR